MRQRLLVVAFAAMLMAFGWAVFGPARQAEAAGGFVAPLPTPFSVLHGFDPPAQPWRPGNRGVDLAATTGELVVAAADGVVVYAGLLAGRGVLSISHGDVRTTYEPVDPLVTRGAVVRRGEVVAQVSAVADGCGPPGGCLHWGAIRGGAYLDPLALLAPPRVRLLPVWTDGLPTPAPSEVATEVATTPQITPAARAAAPSSGERRATDRNVITTMGVAAAATTGAGLATAAVVRRRFVRRSSPAAAAPLWCASGRCGSR